MNGEPASGGPRVGVLVVEDVDMVAQVIVRSLDGEASPYAITRVASLGDALEALDGDSFDVVMLDLDLPDSRGLDTFQALRAHAPNVPIVILTGLADEMTALAAVQGGAQDYLVKGQVFAPGLVRSVRYAIARHATELELRERAMMDDVTDLTNRRGFLDRAEQLLRLADRMRRPALLLFADIDGLKATNDTFGHAMGTQLIMDVADILRTVLRGSDVAARIGGDEFCALLTGEGAIAADVIRHRIRGAIATFNAAQTRPYEVSISIGHVVYDPERPEPLERLIAAADAAMYRDKVARHADRAHLAERRGP